MDLVVVVDAAVRERADFGMALPEADLHVAHLYAGGARGRGRPDEPFGQPRIAEALHDLGLHVP